MGLGLADAAEPAGVLGVRFHVIQAHSVAGTPACVKPQANLAQHLGVWILIVCGGPIGWPRGRQSRSGAVASWVQASLFCAGVFVQVCGDGRRRLQTGKGRQGHRPQAVG